MKKRVTLIYSLIIMVFVSACDTNDLTFTITPTIGFAESSMQIRAAKSDTVDIPLAINAKLTSNATIKINVVSLNGFVYGVDFTTEPAANGGLIELALAPGDTETMIKYLGITKVVTAKKTVLFQLESGTNISVGQSATQDFNLVLTSSSTLQITHDFEGCTVDYTVPDGFIEVIVPGFKEDRGWGCRDRGVDGSRAVRASAFSGTDGEDNAWLIMDPEDLSSYTDITLSFDAKSQYDGPGKVVVQWSSDYDGSGDPTGFTWNVLTAINNQFPAPGSDTFVPVSGNIMNVNGNKFYLAFQYVEGTSASSSSWDIDNLVLTAN